MAKTPQLDLTLHRGQDFNMQMNVRENDNVTPVDLTNYEFAADIRRDIGLEVLSSFAITPVDLVNGTISLVLTNNQTAVLVFDRMVYDVKMVDDTGYVTYLLEGRVLAHGRVTE